ncbi:MAG: hypothetical protein GY870_07140, partial [archaeon]|nr:hypothetical protein [archaeon]
MYKNIKNQCNSKNCLGLCNYCNKHTISPSKLNEKCGIFGVIAHDPSQQVSQIIYQGLMGLQHRGQEAAGISIVNGNQKIHTYKNRGLVSEVLTPEILTRFWGNCGVGHNRYGTAGSTSINNAQPFQFNSTQTSFSLAFNGNIANYSALKERMIGKGRIFTTNGDSEVISQILASLSIGSGDWVEALKLLSRFLDGSYSLIFLTQEGDIYAIRDPLGFKPLCYGAIDSDSSCKYHLVASESCAIDTVGGKLVNDVKPGEIIHLSVDE